MSILLKEIGKSYKLKLLNEQELKEQFWSYPIWLFHYFICDSSIQCMHSIWLFHCLISILFGLMIHDSKFSLAFMFWKPCFTVMFLMFRCWRIFLILLKLMWGLLYHCILKWWVLLKLYFISSSFFLGVAIDLYFACSEENLMHRPR